MDLLCTSDAARLLGVSPDMVRYYARTGRLPASRTPGGVRFFRREDVEAFGQARSWRRGQDLSKHVVSPVQPTRLSRAEEPDQEPVSHVSREHKRPCG